MMDKQKVLSKVAKLMALANSQGASPNEVETALRQARNLMKQYNLEGAEGWVLSVAHVVLLPLITGFLIAIHFWRIRKDGGISGPL